MKVDALRIEGFRYRPLRRQWERKPREQPGGNVADAKRLATELARVRTGREIG